MEHTVIVTDISTPVTSVTSLLVKRARCGTMQLDRTVTRLRFGSHEWFR